MRLGQGVGGALIFGNSSAIVTDAFPAERARDGARRERSRWSPARFLGLVLGGVLAPVSWRLIFLVSVPIGVFGTLWSYRQPARARRAPAARIDWWGNVTFALGLVAVMVGITYGIQPYGRHTMSWTSPLVLVESGGGVGLLVAFCLIESRVAEPMFQLELVPDPRLHRRQHRAAPRAMAAAACSSS